MFHCPSCLNLIGIYIAIIIILGFLFQYVITPVLSAEHTATLAALSLPALSLLSAVMAALYIDSQTTNHWCEKRD